MRGTQAAACHSLALIAGLPLSACAQEKLHSYVSGSDGKKIFDIHFMKMVKEKLTQFDNLQIVVSSCRGGGFADEADAQLAGKFSVTTSRDKKQCEGFDRQVDNANHASGRGGPGLQGMPGDETAYYFGWNAQWIKKMRDDANATATQLFDFAKANDFDPDAQRNTPQHVFRNGGETVKIKLADNKNEALLWATIDSGVFCQLYRGLRDGGYSDGTNENARIDAAYELAQGRNLGKRTDVVYVDRKAEGGTMGDMLDALKNRLDNTKKAFIQIASHGNVASVKADLRPGGAPGFPFQGQFVTPSSSIVSISLDADMATDFFEGVSTNDPLRRRRAPASVIISTSDELYLGSVNVTLDGVPVGSISMNANPLGHDYEIAIPDSAMQGLFSQGAIADLTLEVGFQFSGPTPGFQIARVEDFQIGNHTIYGVGVAAPSLLSVALMDTCYPNCDQSTIAPLLDVNDFICFLSKFAAGNAYANCDRSSLEDPVFNVNDFQCFVNAYAAGCLP